MNSTTACRCVQCSGEFVPDPRVRERQVTCGAPECQRGRHAKQCREWRANNKEMTAENYQDVVVPFRREQGLPAAMALGPTRARCEKTTVMGGALLGRLRGLVSQAEQLLDRAVGSAQTGVLAGEKLRRAVAAVRSTITAFAVLEAS
ncbi:MAG: hypothetical protein IPI67_00015 [Myxococcales bacterium]|nr:hypothetical protein [Myxococcales bacterium]